jgi:hypothetical protein
LPDLPENLLQHVVGIVAASENSQDQSIGAGGMAIVKHRERTAIASRNEADQILI